ncbi:MAG: ImmA/IrrE family metallo-endopeptidase [Pseudanabaena sp. ELA645]
MSSDRAMHQLGRKLGENILSLINSKFIGNGYKKVYIATTVEDADYLAKGILEVIDAKISNLGFACFWNHRFAPSGIKELMVAPIVEEYMEPVCDRIDYLIIATSVISDDCVLKTNLTHLIEKINPLHIIIAAPVIDKGSEECLRSEFEAEISNKFEFRYFAEDNKEESKGNYGSKIIAKFEQSLESIDQDEKNKSTPQIVKIRRDQYISAHKAFKEPDAVELINKKLYAKLDEKKLPPDYVDNIIMPSWWQSITQVTPTNFIQLARALSKVLRLDVQSILRLDTPFEFIAISNQKFKTNKLTEPDQVQLAGHLNSIVAEIVGNSIREPYIAIPNTPSQIRQEILDTHHNVDLYSLVNYCWDHRLPVIHFDKFPEGTRKPDGIAANFGDHPVIVVGSTRKFSSWLLFIVAHELGHIVLGHVKDGILLDENLQTQDRDDEEKQANRFAVELLFGKTDPYLWNQQLDFPNLKRISQIYSKRDHVDQGAVLLNYAKQTNDWAKAIGLLKQIEPRLNAPTIINIFLKQYMDLQNLDNEISEYLHRIEILAA